jgi:hypothetical protein
MDNPDGIGGEFLVNGWMEQVSPEHPAVRRFVEESSEPLAFYALWVEDVVGTTYEGPDLDPVYRRWRAGDQATRPGDPSGAENS